MDDQLSWRAKFAKSNVNILQVHPAYWVVEFTYHPKPNVFKWCKTMFPVSHPLDSAIDTQEYADFVEINARGVLDRVLELRKELEG